MILHLNIPTIVTLFCILNFTIIGNYYGFVSIYGQANNSDNSKNITKVNSDSENIVKVDDINISYKKTGNGDPLLLIMGYSG